MAKIVDTFLFAEAYEAELLLLKLILESPLVDEFVLVESDVTFRGEFKGLQARKLVEEDDRFAPFRDRIAFIEQKGRFCHGPAGYRTYYENEEQSREAGWKYVSEKYSGEDWVFVSDVDEALDATDPARADLFLQHLEEKRLTDATMYFFHYRYWYDFDNRCFWKGISTPVTHVESIWNGELDNQVPEPAGQGSTRHHGRRAAVVLRVHLLLPC